MTFTGFPKETVRFLSALSKHNERAWFEAHRDDYQGYYLAPAIEFVEAIGDRLRKIDSTLHAEPRINGSIARINRDIRFSKDKRPYKDHLDMFFWTGAEKNWDSTGLYFRLSPTTLLLGAGMYSFAPPMLARYREAVLDAKKGAALARVAKKLETGGFDVGGERYKRTPNGIDPAHPRAALLRHGGLYAGWEGKHPKELHTKALIGFAADRFRAIWPIADWLDTI